MKPILMGSIALILSLADARMTFGDEGGAIEPLPPLNSLGVPLVTRQSTPADPTVTYRGTFVSDGRRYRKFESALGSLYVLDTRRFSEHDFEVAACGSQMGPRTQVVSEPAIAGAESTRLGFGGWSAYTAVIQRTIRSRCDGLAIAPARVNPQLELGFSKKVNDPHQEGREYRVYNRNFGRNLNFGADF